MGRSRRRDIQPSWQRRRATRSRTLAELLLRRPDLVGVNALVDVVTEAVSWGV